MTADAKKTAVVLRLARKGPIRARDLASRAVPRTYLRRLCERGQLEQIDRGVYALPGAAVTELTSLVLVARRVPHATICLLSALQVHGLTTEVPHAAWIMIDRKARSPKLGYPSLEVVRASGDALVHGVTERLVEGTSLKITSPAKTVADCFRYRNRVGLDVALDALRGHLRAHRGGMDALVHAAKADRVYTIMRPYLEALA